MKMQHTKKPSGKDVSRQQESALDVNEATKRYKEENEDILFAVEAMRRARLVQESRIRHLLERMKYHVMASN